LSPIKTIDDILIGVFATKDLIRASITGPNHRFNKLINNSNINLMNKTYESNRRRQSLPPNHSIDWYLYQSKRSTQEVLSLEFPFYLFIINNSINLIFKLNFSMNHMFFNSKQNNNELYFGAILNFIYSINYVYFYLF
jgi:hypothetical protein